MKIFFRQKTLDKYVADHSTDFSEANQRNAAKYAIHYYLAFRDFDWWRKALDEAEKDGNKYASLAEMFVKIQEENKK